jgi:hypothetical protein
VHFRTTTVRFLHYKAYFLPSHGNGEALVLGKLPYLCKWSPCILPDLFTLTISHECQLAPDQVLGSCYSLGFAEKKRAQSKKHHLIYNTCVKKPNLTWLKSNKDTCKVVFLKPWGFGNLEIFLSHGSYKSQSLIVLGKLS